MGMINDVYEFQTKVLGNEFPDRRTPANDELKSQTLVRLREEVDEYEEADLLSDQADALVDLIYFALGAAHQCGVDIERVWNDVHAANMRKVKGVTKRGDDNDAAKPDDWEPPTHRWLDDVEAA